MEYLLETLEKLVYEYVNNETHLQNSKLKLYWVFLLDSHIFEEQVDR